MYRSTDLRPSKTVTHSPGHYNSDSRDTKRTGKELEYQRSIDSLEVYRVVTSFVLFLLLLTMIELNKYNSLYVFERDFFKVF